MNLFKRFTTSNQLFYFFIRALASPIFLIGGLFYFPFLKVVLFIFIFLISPFLVAFLSWLIINYLFFYPVGYLIDILYPKLDKIDKWFRIGLFYKSIVLLYIIIEILLPFFSNNGLGDYLQLDNKLLDLYWKNIISLGYTKNWITYSFLYVLFATIVKGPTLCTPSYLFDKTKKL